MVEGIFLMDELNRDENLLKFKLDGITNSSFDKVTETLRDYESGIFSLDLNMNINSVYDSLTQGFPGYDFGKESTVSSKEIGFKKK